MRLDLDTPLFTQKQVLEIVPDLTAKSLQNWVSRKVIDIAGDAPGRQGKRLYTPAGVIALAFMVEVIRMGIPPAVAAEMSGDVMDRAVAFWATEPEEIDEDGEVQIVIKMAKLHQYARGYFSFSNGKVVFSIDESGRIEDSGRAYRSFTYLTVEVDQLTAAFLVRIHRVLAGLSVDRRDTDGGVR